ncbi:hypothetical protein [Bacteroides heparinolyticus]
MLPWRRKQPMPEQKPDAGRETGKENGKEADKESVCAELSG